MDIATVIAITKDVIRDILYIKKIENLVCLLIRGCVKPTMASINFSTLSVEALEVALKHSKKTTAAIEQELDKRQGEEHALAMLEHEEEERERREEEKAQEEREHQLQADLQRFEEDKAQEERECLEREEKALATERFREDIHRRWEAVSELGDKKDPEKYEEILRVKEDGEAWKLHHRMQQAYDDTHEDTFSWDAEWEKNAVRAERARLASEALKEREREYREEHNTDERKWVSKTMANSADERDDE